LLHPNGPEQHDIIAVIALLDLEGPIFYPADQQTPKNRYDWAKAHLENKVKHHRSRNRAAITPDLGGLTGYDERTRFQKGEKLKLLPAGR
jgi:hypothetical protein